MTLWIAPKHLSLSETSPKNCNKKDDIKFILIKRKICGVSLCKSYIMQSALSTFRRTFSSSLLYAPDRDEECEQSEESSKGRHAYFLLCLEYQLTKIIQYRNNNATMLIQYGFSKTGFGNVLRYAITLIVTTTEIIARIIFRNLLFSISFHLLLFYFDNNLYAANTTRKIIANPAEIFGSSIAESNTKKAAKMAIMPSVLLPMSIILPLFIFLVWNIANYTFIFHFSLHKL